MTRNFRELLDQHWREKKFLCIGLDPDYEKIPEAVRRSGVRETFTAFSRAIIDSTKDVVCAYKLNTAFYEAYGAEGIAALREICFYILDQAPSTPIILDAKRADIGNTNFGYADFAFEYLRADSLTLHPYLGAEALEPFLMRSEKGLFVLCRTSNPGSGEFQDLTIGSEPLYMRVAKNVTEQWSTRGNCGLVVGATFPQELANVRAVAPGIPLLIPGVGAQGGDLAAAVHAAKEKDGMFLLSVSRAVLYASSDVDFADAANREAKKLDAAIRVLI